MRQPTLLAVVLVLAACCPLSAQQPAGLPGEPYKADDFAAIRVTDTWQAYADRLTWGKGQCLAILDDGCKLSEPQWQTSLPWGKKVVATWDSIEGDADPSPGPRGYHGTTVGYPSSLNYNGTLGVAFNNQVAHVRSVSVVHLRQDESKTIAAALEWVIENREKYGITTVNLASLDDQRHQDSPETAIDAPLKKLRELGVWVSAPCGNHNYTDGISWPACAADCIAIGATVPGKHRAYLDRFANTDLLVAALATSSSNAYACGCSMILREAIEQAKFDWQSEGRTLPEAMLAIFQKTGREVPDETSGQTYRELDLLAAVNWVFDRAARQADR